MDAYDDYDDDYDEWDFGFSADNERSIQHGVQKTAQNLKVTVVPDVTLNACLNGETFDATLPPDVKEWFNHLKQSWTSYKKGAIISNLFKQFYVMRGNPFEDALKLYANCSDTNSTRTNSMSYTVLEELNLFKKANNTQTVHLLDDNLRMVAYNFGKACNHQSALKLVVETFDLVDKNQLFIDKVKDLISQSNYKDACAVATELKLFEQFTIFEFVFPLILQDKVGIVEPYMTQSVNLQKPLIQLLDSLLDASSSIQNLCGQYIATHDYKGVAYHKLQSKTFTKLVKRLAKQYGLLDTDAMPNVIKVQTNGQLQFLLYKNYSERSLSKESWRELVLEIVPKTAGLELKLDLIEGCVYNSDAGEASHWIRYFRIPDGELPSAVREYVKLKDKPQHAFGHGKSNEPSAKHALPASSSSFHTLPSDKTTIVLVNTKEKYYDMLHFMAAQHIVGVDAEWKPISRASPEVALIQIATFQKIYLIDAISLTIDVTDWNQLAKCVFNNNQILKIAFAPAIDLKMFQKLVQSMDLSAQALSSYLDLQGLWQELLKVPEFKFPYQDEDNDKGQTLSSLVELCLGKKLNKSNQFSNWENRPLRQEQLVYAALDAYCLIEIYHVLEQQCEQIGVNFNEFINIFLSKNKTKVPTKKSPKSHTTSCDK